MIESFDKDKKKTASNKKKAKAEKEKIDAMNKVFRKPIETKEIVENN